VDLRRITHLFGSDEVKVLAYNKSSLFLANEYEHYVLPHFHPYFKHLKPLMTRWQHILGTAHEFPVLETAHGWILDSLNDTRLTWFVKDTSG